MGQGRVTRAAARLVAAVVAIAVGISGLPQAADAVTLPLPDPGPGVSAAVALATGPLDPAGLPVVSRSETTNVFRQEDGNGVLYSYAGPVNWQAPDGRWVPFDTSIIADGLGRFRNRSGPVTVSFAGVSGLGGLLGGAPLVKVGTDSWSVGFNIEGMLPSVNVAVTGGKARYLGLLGGVDVEYNVGEEHVKEIITVPNRAAAGDGVFRFPLEVSGLAPVEDADGSIGFYDAAGVRRAWIPPGVAWDSSGNRDAGIEPRTGPVTVDLVNDGGRPIIEVHASRALLDDPAVVWPVKIDPDVRFGKDSGTTAGKDSYVRSDNPTSTYSGASSEIFKGQNDPATGGYVAKVGYTGDCSPGSSSCVEYNSYFLYDLRPADNQNILSASWNAYIYLQGRNPGSRYVLWPVADAYNIDTVTFNTRPNHFTSGVCDGNNSKCYVPGPGGMLAHDIRPWVHNWTRSAGGWANRGIIVNSAGDTSSFFTFLANEDFTNKSFVRVVYNLPPTASELSPNGGYQTTTTPRLCGKWTDPNQSGFGPYDTGYLSFKVYNSAGTVVEWTGNGNSIGSGGQSCATTGPLSQGFHSWSAQPWDGREWGPVAWGTGFTVDTVAPGAPAISSSSHGVESPPGTQWYSARTVAGSISGPAGDTSGINGYSVELNRNADPAYLPAASVNSSGAYSLTASTLDDGQWYVHARARDNAGLWSNSADHYGVRLDSTKPTAATITTTSHVKGVCTSSRAITVNWSPGSDVTSGVAGYRWVFNTDPAMPPAADRPLSTSTTASYDVPVSGDGSYWFHVQTIDNAGNVADDATYGPICIDGNAPPVNLSPTLGQDMVAQSDELGLEQFGPYRSFPLGGSATAYVQLRSGNLVARFEDASVPGQGLNTVISHVYNSQRQSDVLHDNGLGKGWTLSVSDLEVGLDGVEGAVEDVDITAPISLARADVIDGASTITGGYVLEFTDGDGTTHRFIRKGGIGSRWDSPPGVSLRVREEISGGGVTAYELVRPDGVVYRAENIQNQADISLPIPTWKFVKVSDRNGNSLAYSYVKEPMTGKVRLSTIRHNRYPTQDVARFQWNNLGQLASIITLPGLMGPDPAVTSSERLYQRELTFTYENGLLTSVTENSQSGSNGRRTTVYGYTGGQLTSVKDPNSHGFTRPNLTKFAYTGSGYTAKVTSVIDRRQSMFASPKPWTFTYSPDPVNLGEQNTNVVSPTGDTTTYHTSARQAVQPAGDDRRIAGGNVTSISDAGYGEGPVTTTYRWAENRMVSSKDGEGAETTFVYDDLGMLLEVTEPAPNDPTRTDLPTDAPKTPIKNRLTYSYPVVYPASCPTAAPGPDAGVTEQGYCAAVAELTRTTFAVDTPAQRHTDFTFDGRGNMASATQRSNPNGSATNPSCDATTGICSGDRTTTFEYYDRGGLKKIDGPRGETPNDGLYDADPTKRKDDVTTYGNLNDQFYGGYDRSGQPTVITDALGKQKTFRYSPYGMVVEAVDRDNRKTISGYDDRDNLVSVTDPRGDKTTYAYDFNDNKTRETTPRGQTTPTADDFTTIWTYDVNDWLTETSWPGATANDPPRVATVAYNDNGTKASESTPRAGSQTVYTQTPNQLAVAKVDRPGQTTAQRSITDYVYDRAGRVKKVTAPAVNAGGDRPVTETTYTPAGDPNTVMETSAVTGTKRETRFAYNAHREEIQESGPRTDPTGVKESTETAFNAFAEAIQTERRITSSRELLHITGYDLAGQIVRSTQPTGNSAQLESLYRFDAVGRLAAQTKDPVNAAHKVTYAYSGEGQQTERIDWAYSATDPSVPLDCAPDDLPTPSGCAPQRTTSYVFNPDNTRQAMVAADHLTGQVLATCNWDDPDKSGDEDPSSGYDPDGNLLVTRTVSTTVAVPIASPVNSTSTCGGGTLLRSQTFGYDGRNWNDTSTQKVRSPETGSLVSRTQNFAYDPDGERAAMTHDGRTTNYEHSPAGWTTKITDWRGRISNISYRPSGGPASQTLNEGGASTMTATFDYHADGMPKSLSWQAGSNVVRSHTNIGYDVGGLRTSETIGLRQPGATSTTTGTATFTHDALDRLTSWVAPFPETTTSGQNTVYSLDDGGNILTEIERTGTTAGSGTTKSTTTSTYVNGRLSYKEVRIPNGLTNNGDCSNYHYNAIGEQTGDGRYYAGLLGCPTTIAPTHHTSYDPAGHTVLIDDRQSLANNDASYVYDTTDRVIARTDPDATGSAKTTLYFYWGNSTTVAEETDGTGQTMVRYLVDGDLEVLGQDTHRTSTGTRNATATWNWLLIDTNGNVATHVDDNGTVLAQVAFDPYGKPKTGGANTASGAPGTSLGFQGGLTDKITGNILLGARQYDPKIARFTTPDVFVASALDLELGTDALTGNRYLFAGANPVAFYEDGHRFGIPKFIKKVAKKAIPYVPVVGAAVEAVSLATGRDLLDGGRKISGQERIIRAGALAAGAALGAGTGAIAARAITKAAGKAGPAAKLAAAGVREGDGLARETTVYANRVWRRAEEDTFHRFPLSVDKDVLRRGTIDKVDNKQKYTQKSLAGTRNGRSGRYEIGYVSTSSGRGRMITHRFFNPTR